MLLLPHASGVALHVRHVQNTVTTQQYWQFMVLGTFASIHSTPLEVRALRARAKAHDYCYD